MEATINNIILDSYENTLLCEIIYRHENGDIFREYETLSPKDITEQLSYEEIVLMLEHLDSEDLARTISALYLFTIHQMSGNYSYVIFGSDEEYEAIEEVQSRVSLDMMEAIACGVDEDEDMEALEQNFYSYYHISATDGAI